MPEIKFTDPPQVTLKVPAEYVELFRLAALHEVGHDASWVKSMQEELIRAQVMRGDELAGDALEDIHGSKSALDVTVHIAEQAFGAEDEATITSDPGALAHVLEAMAREVVAPKIAGEAGYSPIEADDAERVAGLGRALLWVCENVGELHRQAVPRLGAVS